MLKRKGYVEVKIASGEDWKNLEPDVKRLCAAIVQGRKSLQEKQAVNEREVVKEQSEADT